MSRESSQLCLSPQSPFWSWSKSKQQDYLTNYFKKSKYKKPINTKKIEPAIQKIIHQLVDNYNLIQSNLNRTDSYMEYSFRSNEPRLPIVLIKTQQCMEMLLQLHSDKKSIKFYCESTIQLLNQLNELVQMYNHMNVYMWFDTTSIVTQINNFNNIKSTISTI